MSIKIKEYLGHIAVGVLDGQDIDGYWNRRMQDDAKNIPGTKDSESTIRHELVFLRSAYNRAKKKWRWRMENPFDFYELKNPTKHRVLIITKEEANRLYKVLTEPNHELKWLLPIVIIARDTGARRGSLEELKWTDVDFGNLWVVFRKTKNGRPIGLPMTDNCLFALRRLSESRNSMVEASEQYVFIDKKGKRITGGKISRSFREACKIAEIKDLKFHDLRHDCATTLRKCGVELHVIKEWLGHENLEVTQRYAHYSGNELMLIAAKKLNRQREMVTNW